MNIVTFCSHYDPEPGGIVTVTRETSRELARAGHQVTIVVLGDTRGEGDEATPAGVRVLRRPDPTAGRRMGHIRGLSATLAGLEDILTAADIVHIHGYHTVFGPQLVKALAGRGVPLVFQTHFHGHGHRMVTRLAWPFYNHWARRAFKRVAAVVCVSQYEADLLGRLPGAPPVHVVPNGVAKITTTGAKSARRAPPQRLIFVGFLEAYKGVGLLLEAFALYQQRQPAATLRYIGTGPEQANLEARAKALGVSDAVSFMGRLPADALANQYVEADALVLLSTAEAYGLVVAEALAAGTPALILEAAALGEFAGLPGCASVPEGARPHDVAAAMERMPGVVALPAEQEKILTWHEVASRMVAVYETVARASP